MRRLRTESVCRSAPNNESPANPRASVTQQEIANHLPRITKSASIVSLCCCDAKANDRKVCFATIVGWLTIPRRDVGRPCRPFWRVVVDPLSSIVFTTGTLLAQNKNDGKRYPLRCEWCFDYALPVGPTHLDWGRLRFAGQMGMVHHRSIW
jgi:hypothetical protein